jgi:type II secretory pathway pseudopilin PulG
MAAVSDIRKRMPGPGRGGFTLVELLVIIMIIMIVLAISMPSISRVRREIRANHSQSIVNLIHGACLHYHQELGAYPLDVRHLVRQLTGYRKKGTWDPKTSRFAGGDGLDGYGMRLRPRGRKYGPYNGAQDLRRTKLDGVDFFLDAFDGTILYSRFTEDRWQSLDDYDGPGNMTEYLKNVGGKFFRTDFVVISRGPNGKWEPYCEDSGGRREWTGSDDITNLLNE